MDLVLIVYGRPKYFMGRYAHTIEKSVDSKYTAKVVHVDRDLKFIRLIKSVSQSQDKIVELHVISHGTGEGIFFGYNDKQLENARSRVRSKRVITMKETHENERGALGLYDFEFSIKDEGHHKAFAKNAFIKLWGCNQGVKNWDYAATDDDGDGLEDDIYWRRYNEYFSGKHNPSIAQKFADFFRVTTFGPTSATEPRAYYKGKWLPYGHIKKKYKLSRRERAKLPLRLEPAKGDYKEFKPRAAKKVN